MVAYANYLETTLDPKTGLSSDGVLGDWLGPQNALLGSAFLVTAYHAYDLAIMAKVAAVLGKTADAARFTELAEKRKAFFNTTFVNAEKKTMATGRSGFGPRPSPADGAPAFRLADTQTSYAVGLGLGVFSPENVPFAVKNLADAVARDNKDDDGVTRPGYSLMTGFIGTAWISKALSQHGQSGLAYRQLLNASYPSWLYAVDQGATTIWERLRVHHRERVRRKQQHELLQPLLVRRRWPVDDGALARHRAR
jgi:alpha-L-rhamnosidase